MRAAVMTEQPKPDTMTDDLQPGEECWIRAEYSGPGTTKGTMFFMASVLKLGFRVGDTDDIRKSSPSESETAELDARIADAAERVFAVGMVYQDKAMEALEAAVIAKRKALAPPSLEEQIKQS